MGRTMARISPETEDRLRQVWAASIPHEYRFRPMRGSLAFMATTGDIVCPPPPEKMVTAFLRVIAAKSALPEHDAEQTGL